jgi:hypothetical protein
VWTDVVGEWSEWGDGEDVAREAARGRRIKLRREGEGVGGQGFRGSLRAVDGLLLVLQDKEVEDEGSHEDESEGPCEEKGERVSSALALTGDGQHEAMSDSSPSGNGNRSSQSVHESASAAAYSLQSLTKRSKGGEKVLPQFPAR